MDEEFTKNRQIIYKRLNDLDARWSLKEKAAAEEVCRKMEELAQLAFYFGVNKALKYWDDPIAKSWIILEAFVEKERKNIKWADKWKGFSDLGEAAVEKLKRENRLSYKSNHSYNNVGFMEPKHWLYHKTEEPARTAKISLQMVVGVTLFILLFIKLADLAFSLSNGAVLLEYLADHAVLEIIAAGLAVSAGIELIYMLFTDGPDEAVQPLIYGIAAVILIILSDDAEKIIQNNSALTVLALSLVLAILFYLQREFIIKKVGHDSGSSHKE